MQVFQQMTENQAQRVADLLDPSTDDLLRLIPDDIAPPASAAERPPPRAGRQGRITVWHAGSGSSRRTAVPPGTAG